MEKEENIQATEQIHQGLCVLTELDAVAVQQHLEVFEILTGFETQNLFTIWDKSEKQILLAREVTDCWRRNLLGDCRSAELVISNAQNQEVMHFKRQLRFQNFCFPCCLQIMEVYSPPGNLMGTVEQLWSILSTHFAVKDADGETLFSITGPMSILACVQAEFVIEKGGKKVNMIKRKPTLLTFIEFFIILQIGIIQKNWSGLIQELATDADNFAIEFPPELTLKVTYSKCLTSLNEMNCFRKRPF